MKFDLIDLGKPEGEKLMDHNVWIGFQTVSELMCLEDLLNTLLVEAETRVSQQHD